MDLAFVYILRCADGSFYTGITRRNVDERVSEHNAGLGGAPLQEGARCGILRHGPSDPAQDEDH